jgi:selenide, water dikinase
VRALPKSTDPDLLVGADDCSDAAVYQIAPGVAIVQSVDFFAPIVDDPFVFGQIAAANSLSDLYAMGAKPRLALNIVGFPEGEADPELLHEILRGGAERVMAAGAVVAGGHSVRDREIKYGLCATGTVDPALMRTNGQAKPGDLLVLTKPLGTGIIATANKAERCPDDLLERACASMIALNDKASDAAAACGSVSATDITGFGLAGHTIEMAKASGVTIHMRLDTLPLLDGVLELADPANLSGASATNRAHCETDMQLPADADARRTELVFDPQTSGGLLIAVSPDRADALVEQCRAGGATDAAIVGSVEAAGTHSLVLE